MILYIENPKESTKKKKTLLIGTSKWVEQDFMIQDQFAKVLYTSMYFQWKIWKWNKKVLFITASKQNKILRNIFNKISVKVVFCKPQKHCGTKWSK